MTFSADHPLVVDQARIAHLEAMEDNWDSYGARPPTSAAMRVVRATCLVPTGDGGVQFEWHVGGWNVEIEFGPDGTLRSVFSEVA